MKQTNLLFVLAIFIGAQMLYSCSSSSNFTKRKYFNFKQDQKEYARVEPGTPAPADNAAIAEEETVLADETASEAAVTPAEVNTATETPFSEPAETAQAKAPAIEKSPASSIQEEKLSFGEKLVVKQAQKIAKREQKKESSRIETLLLVIIAILLPPLAVFLVEGLETEFWISLLLTLLFYVPGLIYALYIVLTRS